MHIVKNIFLLFFCILLTGCGKNAVKENTVAQKVDHNTSQRFKYFYAEATNQMQKGNYAAAVDLLTHCIELNPKAAEAYFNMTAFYAEMEKDSLALDCMEKAVSLSPGNVTYQERLAQTYIGTKKWDKAIDAYERLMTSSPNRTDVLGILIQLYGQSKNYDKIIDCLDRIENIEGANEQTALSKMHVYSLKGEKDKELQVLKDLSAKHPNDMNYHVMMGNWLMQNGEHMEAYDEYKYALQQEPSNTAAKMSLLDYYRTMDNDSLVEVLQEELLINPETSTADKVTLIRKVVSENEQNGADSSQVIALFKRILSHPQKSSDLTEMYAAYLQLKNFPQDSINTLYRQALRIEPDNASVRLSLIQALWQDDSERDEVIRLSKEATQYNPDEMVFYYFLAIGQFQNGDKEAALDALRRGVNQINHKSNKDIVSDFYALMGDILHEKGQVTEAYAAYDSCLQWKPDNVPCLNNYAYYLSEQDTDLEKAERMSKKTVEAEPENPTFLDTYAWIMFKQGRYEEAKEYIDRTLEHSDDADAVLLEHAGDIYCKHGDLQEAVDFWKEALSKESKNAKTLKRKIKLRRYIE
ncbi:MAG: tetratricopeptide repeat protein [Prevotella sp.]|nr:tetratricopeptide repeat protein [Prevotella sp.]